MHLIDISAGVMGASAVVGTTIPNAVGYAYALKLQRKSAVVVSFFGEGALEEGVCHESLNFAALKKLAVIFVCENNRYAIHTHQSRRQASLDICRRIHSYGIPAERIEDNNTLQIYDRLNAAATCLRAGDPGPFFFECMTYRWKEHVGPNEDFDLGYRRREEAQPWIEGDEVKRLKSMLDHKTCEEVEQEIEAEIVNAFESAERAPFPGPEELYTNMYE